MLWFWNDCKKRREYQEGFEVGYLGTGLSNPYPLQSDSHNLWEEGRKDGNSFFETPTYPQDFRGENVP